MPYKAATPCSAPGCTRLAVLRGRCAIHKRDERPSSPMRGYDRTWAKIRTDFVRDHPYCESPEHSGQHVAVADVDHIIPLVDGGTNDPSNLQSLCRSCHVKKTYKQTRGRVG